MQKDLSTLEYGLAGAASGIFTRFSCQPFDVLKIRLQVSYSLMLFLFQRNSFFFRFNLVQFPNWVYNLANFLTSLCFMQL